MNILVNTAGFLILICTSLLFVVLVIRLFIFYRKKGNFPKILLLATTAGTVLFLGLFIYRVYFFTFSSIDRKIIQQGLGPLPSPTGKYTAHAFYEPYGGAAGGVNVWVEITLEQENQKVQTVYYSDEKSQFSMKWKDEDRLFIQNEEPNEPTSNRNIELEMGKEIYDEKGLACRSFLMKKEYEKCYQN
ncbi:DUF5412 domain-containing protein [Cytobacillus spongiae]|uniref:DUF5412 family protein n=1 Tax=Cytobacillus spongiae TaxID=2901381 RepID=UPI001F2E5EDF|nr:DUF5412 family protein [Cytobacillus spongiae]UII57625.1 DUF5412 domain-containing protein [Cytobacillus spongiae]